MSVNLQVLGLSEVLRNIEQFPKKFQRRIVNSALRDASKPITSATRKAAPVRSGALRRSVRPTTVRAGKIGPVMLIHVGIRRKYTSRRNVSTPGGKVRMSFKREEDAFYAKFVEFGAKAHLIKANKKALKINGRFVGKVRHPGTKRQDFFSRTIDATAQTSTQVFAKQVQVRLAQVRSANNL
jgi:HK97 gp10 family phage protein